MGHTVKPSYIIHRGHKQEYDLNIQVLCLLGAVTLSLAYKFDYVKEHIKVCNNPKCHTIAYKYRQKFLKTALISLDDVFIL